MELHLARHGDLRLVGAGLDEEDAVNIGILLRHGGPDLFRQRPACGLVPHRGWRNGQPARPGAILQSRRRRRQRQPPQPEIQTAPAASPGACIEAGRAVPRPPPGARRFRVRPGFFGMAFDLIHFSEKLVVKPGFVNGKVKLLRSDDRRGFDCGFGGNRYIAAMQSQTLTKAIEACADPVLTFDTNCES